MLYRFATEPRDYSDYASGHVFYGAPGHPALPIRLASELLQRCLALRQARGETGPCCIYDPCCGGAYHLCTLAFLHWQAIAELIASDVDPDALALAAGNLSLLTADGLHRRREEIAALFASYSKESHRIALQAADRLQSQLGEKLQQHPIRARLFRADATDAIALTAALGGTPVDLVLTDLPYGWQVDWQMDAPERPDRPPVWHLLDALGRVLRAGSLVAVVADKRQTPVHEQYRRLEQFRVGKRQAAILQVDRAT